MTNADLSLFFQAKEAPKNERCGGRFRLVVHKLSTRETELKEFESALEAFFFAERERDLEFAELWQNDRGLCELRKIELPSGNIWQIAPIVAPTTTQAERREHLGVGEPAIRATKSAHVLRSDLTEEAGPVRANAPTGNELRAWRRHASSQEASQPVSLFQLLTRGNPPGSDDVRPLPTEPAER